MKKLLIPIVALVAAISCADIGEMLESNDPNKVVFTTQLEDGSTNTWTQADLVAALGLLNRKYHRDCESPSGRKAWHGRLAKEIIDEDAETKTEVHEDGTTFVYHYRKVTPSQAVKDYNSRLTTVKTNGIPASLARARLKYAEDCATTNTVNHVLKAGDVSDDR
ncbi:MAG: hypothetical protein IKC27_09055 [Kiritimatiellae bacterium]|nr:hypothetical protein [Kiritimatiellia bacterium]